ncbi:biotin/lipoate A/B protein ligase family protein [Sporolactobacillus sp. Y61]|jgi:lipoate-protein ligase A|uniref:Biotin/lipoate A/B protein ligase family protein n=1 Tax=Sporolactobacillus sp. Y61 TaxID=3160863 RepID=A0AAU8IC51_9BACL|nr:biotin/lipoate A/B protein ligase family protein [Sporolactobacillus sp. THM19-2]RYL93561.1 lipoate--protein ligase family protein [Sporolactobacillus sp. THM19-2]
MQSDHWSFMDSGRQTPAYNMALDEYLLNRGAGGRKKPVLRFYGWDPPGLSIGYFQKTKGRISSEGIRRHGIKLVRRLTGGQAVLHHHELTYSVLIPEDDPDMPGSVVGAYRLISEGLLKGFSHLGLHAELAIPEKKKSHSHSPVCFEEASWYELVVEGRKAAGSAQTRQKGMILQHGSIPIDIDREELFDCFIYPNNRVRDRARQAFLHKAVTIDEIARRRITLDEVKQAFYQGFEQGLGIKLETEGITRAEEEQVRILARTKYETDAWNWKR